VNADTKLSSDQKEFDPSERARIRNTVNMVAGNGRAGIDSRIRRLEWIGGFILAGLTGLFIEGIVILMQQAK